MREKVKTGLVVGLFEAMGQKAFSTVREPIASHLSTSVQIALQFDVMMSIMKSQEDTVEVFLTGQQTNLEACACRQGHQVWLEGKPGYNPPGGF